MCRVEALAPDICDPRHEIRRIYIASAIHARQATRQLINQAEVYAHFREKPEARFNVSSSRAPDAVGGGFMWSPGVRIWRQ